MLLVVYPLLRTCPNQYIMTMTRNYSRAIFVMRNTPSQVLLRKTLLMDDETSRNLTHTYPPGVEASVSPETPE